MLTVEKINREMQKLPEPLQNEVLDFVEFLLHKSQGGVSQKEEREWNHFSLKSAMKGMEDDVFPEYSESDYIEKWD
jgi:hypothetical protein